MDKEKGKICPLTYIVEKGAYDQENADFYYFVKKRCAWWDGLAKNCAILVIAKMSKTEVK